MPAQPSPHHHPQTVTHNPTTEKQILEQAYWYYTKTYSQSLMFWYEKVHILSFWKYFLTTQIRVDFNSLPFGASWVKTYGQIYLVIMHAHSSPPACASISLYLPQIIPSERTQCKPNALTRHKLYYISILWYINLWHSTDLPKVGVQLLQI